MSTRDTHNHLEEIAQMLKTKEADVGRRVEDLKKRRNELLTFSQQLPKDIPQLKLAGNALRYEEPIAVSTSALNLSQSPWSSPLHAIRELLRDAGFERISSYAQQCDTYADKLGQIETQLDAFMHSVNALSYAERMSLHYLALGSDSTRADGQLAALLFAYDQFDDEKIVERCSNHPQALPPPSLFPLLVERHPYLSAQKLFAHINSLSPGQESVGATSESLSKCVHALWALADEHFSWSTEVKGFTYSSDNWMWPFHQIQNEHIENRYDINISEQPIRVDGMTVHFASIPSDASRQKPSASEDSLWFSISNRNEFVAILADGASQSAFGGIAANVLCTNVMRYIQTHQDTVILKDDFSHICKLAAAQARSEVDKRIQTREKQQADNAASRILRKRNAVGGSQAVFALVQKHGDIIHCISAGNVRIVIPGHIDLGSQLFASDAARFASLPESGLIGDINVKTYKLTNDAFSVTIHSDALENDSVRLVELGSLNRDTLMAAAQADDTTYISFRYPVSA